MHRRAFLKGLGLAALASGTRAWTQEVPATGGLDLLAYSLGPIVRADTYLRH